MTPRQREVYDFIGAYWAQHKVAPTYQEIADGVDSNSRSAVFKLIHSLIALGHATVVEGKRRSIQIVASQEILQQLCDITIRYRSQIIDGDQAMDEISDLLPF